MLWESVRSKKKWPREVKHASGSPSPYRLSGASPLAIPSLASAASTGTDASSWSFYHPTAINSGGGDIWVASGNLVIELSSFVERCVDGIKANRERCRAFVDASVGIVTALVPVIGYERSAQIATEALESGSTVRELVLGRGWMHPNNSTPPSTQPKCCNLTARRPQAVLVQPSDKLVDGIRLTNNRPRIGAADRLVV